MRYENCPPSQKVRSRKHSNNARNIGNGVSAVEGTMLKGTVLKMSNKVFIAKVWSFFEHALYTTFYYIGYKCLIPVAWFTHF